MTENSLSAGRRRFRGRIDRALLAIVCTVVAIGAGACASSSKNNHSVELLQSRKMISNPSVYMQIRKPASQDELLRNVKFIIDHDLLLRRDFYTDENMLRFFAAKNGESGVEESDERMIHVWFITSEFDGIFQNFWDRNYLIPDAQISTGVNFKKNEGIIGRINLNIQKGQISFERANEIFDRKLMLDKTIPPQPPSPATGAHGNEEWEYRHETNSGEITGYFRFNGDGRLGGIFLEEKGD